MLRRAFNRAQRANTFNAPNSPDDMFYDAGNAPASSDDSIYDAVVHIGKLNDILTDGWKVTIFEPSEASKHRSTLHYNDSLLVGILGTYNRGKSFLLNKLCKTQFRTGRLLSTEGISIAGPRETFKNLVFIDTAGTDTPTKREDLDDKRAIEALLREIVLGLSSYIIIVMNRLQLTDQIYMHEVLAYCSKLSPQERPEIILVHNLLDLELEDDVEAVIEKEIQGILGAKPTTIQQRNDGECKEFKMFSSTAHQIPIRHFIMTKDGSLSANTWNAQSLDSLMSILQADIPRRRSVDILGEILMHINIRLPRLLSSNNGSDIDVSKIKVVKHEQEPYLVLSELKGMSLEDRKQHNSSLSVSPKLLYDDRGYLVGIISAGTEKWQPRYRKYKTAEYVTILVELAGFNEDNLFVEMEKSIVVVRGDRVEAKEANRLPTTDQFQYPIGPLELFVNVEEDIDSDNTQFDCKDGFLTITCPLRKYAKKRFGQTNVDK